jgi:ATP-dependent helicase/nuclease subunit A
MSDGAFRQAAVEQRDRSIALAAGAGAGKTRILVERVLGLLEDGARPERIAAITFTEAAAGEARSRIRISLDARIGDGRASETLTAARAGLGRMAVTTIHAFALDLIQQEAFVAGWLPSTQITESVLQTLPLPAARQRWRSKLLADHPETASKLARSVKTYTLDQALEALSAYRDLEPVVPDPSDVPKLKSELFETLRGLDELSGRCTRPAECKFLQKATPYLAAIRSASDANELTSLLPEQPLGRAGQLGRSSDWPDASLDEAKTHYHRAIDIHKELSLDPETLRTVLLHAKEHFVPLFAEEKRRAALAGYDDILFAAEELLRTSPEVWKRSSDRFDYILIDEVQDTDPLQAAIVARLAAKDHTTGNWVGRPPSPGRLFAVGDEAQSIYRFRRAEWATWNKLQNTIAADGDRLSASRNFRSVPGIVDFVNEAFGGQDRVQKQQAFREASDELAPVALLRPEGTKAEDETAAIVAYLDELIGSGEVEPRDCMIVLPAWSKAEGLHEALSKADIPSFVDGGKTFFERHETEVGLHILSALGEPANEESVVAVLRGAFGHSFEELAEHKKLGGGWRYTAASQPSSSPLGPSLEALKRARRKRGARSLVEPLDEILEESGVLGVWSLMARGTGILANVEKLRSLVRDMEAAGMTRTSIVETLQGMARSRDKDEDLPLRPFTADAVEITTIFKAKGRQAKIVVVAHPERVQRSQSPLVRRMTNELAVDLSPLRPSRWDQFKIDDNSEDAKERIRWMYVAATRAQDQLVLPWHEDRKTDDPRDALGFAIGKRLPDPSKHEDGAIVRVGAASIQIRRMSPLDASAAARSRFGARLPVVEEAMARSTADLGERARDASLRLQAFRTERTELVRGATRRSTPWRSVKEIATERVRRRGVPFGPSTGIGADAGSLVHRVLENVDLQAAPGALKSDALEELQLQARLMELSDEAASNATETLEALLEHPVMVALGAAPEVWQETPFAYRRDGQRPVVVNGIIDLVFPTDENRTHWTIVDWKTDRPQPGSHAEQIYQEQLSEYAKGFLRTWRGAEVTVETHLVGPVESAETTWDAVFEDADPVTHGLLDSLKRTGVPPPVVGLELDDGTPGPELAWPERKGALRLDERDPAFLDWRIFDLADTGALIDWLVGGPSEKD